MQIVFIVLNLILLVAHIYLWKRGFYQNKVLKGVFGALLAMILLVTISGSTFSIKNSLAAMEDYETVSRLKLVESALSREDMGQAKTILTLYDCYETDFDYAWEQIDMYELYNRYLIYLQAAEVENDIEMKERFLEKALKMKADLAELCTDSTFDKNQSLVEHYSELVQE